jgi:hypothetical protein
MKIITTDTHGYCTWSAQKDYEGYWIKNSYLSRIEEFQSLLKETNQIIEETDKAFFELHDLFENGRIVFILGAGVSMSCGLPSWEGLINNLAHSILADKLFKVEIQGFLEKLKRDMGLAGLAEGLSTFSTSLSQLEFIKNDLYSKEVKVSEFLITIIATVKNQFLFNSKINRPTIILSFNYDTLIEQRLEFENIPFVTETKLPSSPSISCITIVHLHGLIEPNKGARDVILTESSYGHMYLKNEIDPISQIVNQGYIPFFLGFSFNDNFVRNVLHSYRLKGNKNCALTLFSKKDLYQTVEEKAAHLLYFMVKNHPFVDGNKRSGAFIFVWFLNKMKILNMAKMGGLKI